jgi:hypothetical protein
MRDRRKRFYSKGLTCQCRDAPIVNNNRSGVCNLCSRAMFYANRDAFTSEALEEKAQRLARDVLRIAEGVKL